MREINWNLREWVYPVLNVMNLYDRDIYRMSGLFLVGWASHILVEHYSALMALDAIKYRDYSSGEYALADGIDAVIMLTSTHYKSQSIMGYTRIWEPRAMPCPKDGGCGRYELGTWVGTGEVMCRICGWKTTMSDYENYVLTFIPNGSQYKPEG